MAFDGLGVRSAQYPIDETHPTTLSDVSGQSFALATFSYPQVLKRTVKLGESTGRCICRTCSAEKFVDHQCKAPVTGDATELDGQLRPVGLELRHHSEVTQAPDQRTPSKDDDPHSSSFVSESSAPERRYLMS